MEVSVVIPTYNEGENIGPLIDEIEDELSNRDFEIIVVDDGSDDGTPDRVKDRTDEYGNVKLVERDGKSGIGSAYKEGFTRADGDIVVQSDADFSHPPRFLEDIIAAVGDGSDIAVGSRYIEDGSRNDPILRRINPLIGSYIYRYFLGCSVRDFTSGFKAYNRAAVEEILDVRDSLPDGFHYQAASLMHLLDQGYTAEEVPIDFMPRKAGTPKYSFTDFVDNVALLVKLGVKEYDQLIKFGIVGGAGALVDMSLLYIFTEYVGLQYMLSAVISKETSTIANFSFNEAWTFMGRGKNGRKNMVKRVLKFNLVSIAGVVLNLAILYALTEFAGIYYLLSNMIAILLVFAWNYMVNSRWTWKEDPDL
ncbi:MAG: glycosyltransferase [Candidatus Nanohaloarchaea archaeon]